MNIRIAGVEKNSTVDGEGIRYVIFLQGCVHHCKNCHNSKTWDINGGKVENTDSLYKDIMNHEEIDGVTISGGDPILQADRLVDLCKKLKESGINIWLYTGYTFEDIADKYECFKYIDVCMDGKYEEDKRCIGNSMYKYRGSSNQRAIDVQYYLSTGEVREYEIQ